MKSKEFFYSRAKKKFWQVNKLYFVLYFVVTRILSHSFVTSPQKITFNKEWGSTSQITKGRIQLKLKKPPKNKRPKAKNYILPWPGSSQHIRAPIYFGHIKLPHLQLTLLLNEHFQTAISDGPHCYKQLYILYLRNYIFHRLFPKKAWNNLFVCYNFTS